MILRVAQTTIEIELPPAKRRVDRAEKGPGIVSCPAPKWDVEVEGETTEERNVESK